MPESEKAQTKVQSWKAEAARWCFLCAVATWLFHPFATSRFYGTGDALWYANMLADYVLQLRAGIFPVWVGQTEYAFNGAVYPLRVAPMYQHVGGALDFITFHRLTFFELQHLIIITTGVAGLVSCYLCLRAVLPRNRWPAAMLATLYVSCPGALALVYTQDLHMSWMTLPFLPIAVYGAVRSFDRDDWSSWLAIAIGLGGAWLAHAPIAMWITSIVSVMQIVRLLTVHRAWPSWKRAILGGLLFAAIAQYPFVSVKLLQSPGAAPADGGSLPNPEKIILALQNAFPGCVHPLSAGAGELSDIQLGYGLAVGLLAGLIALIIRRHMALALLIAAAVALLSVALPIPHWDELFWLKLAPEVVRRLSYYWPMHRLYIVIASLLTFGFAVAVASLTTARTNARTVMSAALILACGWSLYETRQFIEAGRLRTATALDTERKQRPENRLLMNHAYGLFAKLPPYFSNGVVDPDSQFRLLQKETWTPVQEWTHTREIAAGTFVGKRDANPGVINLEPALVLKPGIRYELEFNFGPHEYDGVLQLVGTTFFREYVLPESGEFAAFGTRSPNDHRIILWTTRDSPERILVRYVPRVSSSLSIITSGFATFRLFELDPRFSIKLKSRCPLTLEVNSPAEAELETPLEDIPVYLAVVNDNAVQTKTSAAGLLSLPVPKGQTIARIEYHAPLFLKLSYTLALMGTVIALGLFFCILVARVRISTATASR